MIGSQVGQRAFDYRCYETSETIWGTKEQIQSFGIAIGLAFPGEPSGPKRQLSARDPRGFEVKITKTHWKDQPFSAQIVYPGIPERPKPHEDMPYQGVRRREEVGNDEFTGRAADLIAARLVQEGQLPGDPGMRKTRVTILSDGSVLSGYYSNNIPEAVSAGAKSVERASSRSDTFTVRVQINRSERDRRQSRREIAQSAWLHEVRKLPRPRKLTQRYCDAVSRIDEAAVVAKVDAHFQAMLCKLIDLPAGDAA